MKKAAARGGLFVFEAPINRFSVSYMLSILERAGYLDRFEVRLFRHGEEEQAALAAIGYASSVFMYSFMTPLLPAVRASVAAVRRGLAGPGAAGRALFIAGGSHPTGDPLSCAAIGFDLVFTGEAERSWVEFLEKASLAFGAADFAGEVAGSYPGRVVPGCSDVVLDEHLPISTCYELVPPLEIMRGCHYKCRFCQTSTFGVKYRGMDSIEEFCREYNRLGYKRLCFICPSAFHYASGTAGALDTRAVEHMLETASVKYSIRFVEYGIFPSEARPETITDLTAGLIRRYCSNRRVSVGAQTGDEGRLRKIGRGHMMDEVERACSTLRANGLTPIVDMIFGFPGETEEEQLATISAMKRLHTRYGARIQTHYFLSLPGTPLYGEESSPLGSGALRLLEKYSRGGVCTDWYADGIAQAASVKAALADIRNGSGSGL